MAHPLDIAAGEAVCDRRELDADAPRGAVSTYTIIEDEFTVVVEISKGAGPFSAAELDVYERYMGHILDAVLGK